MANDLSASVQHQTSSDALDVALGASIRLRRKQLKISQESLAEKSGVSFQQIQKYENGTNRISFSRLVRIASALRCSVSDLASPLEATHHNLETPVVHLRLLAIPGASELLTSFELLDEAGRAALLKLMRG